MRSHPWCWVALIGLVIAGCGGSSHQSTGGQGAAISNSQAGASPTTESSTAQSPTTATPAGSATTPEAATATTTAPPTTQEPTTQEPTTTLAPATTQVPTTTMAQPAAPYPISETTLLLVDPSRPTVAFGRQISATRALTTLVWAPAVVGRWPLVVFAHGFQVGPTPYIALLEHWASAGYVVAAPEFPLTDQAVAGANLDENDMANQPADVRFVTDALVAPGAPLAARIDPTRVAVAGHSDGAETALASSLALTTAGEPVFKAVIVMSGQPVTSGQSANPPILVTQGDADTINPPSNGYATFAQASSPKYLEVLHGANHLPPEEAGTSWYPALSGVTTAFLNYYVAGDGSAQALLSAGTQPPYASIQTG
jgi:acetyl esterase/lipase